MTCKQRFVVSALAPFMWGLLTTLPTAAQEIRQEDFKLLPSDGRPGDRFGDSVAVHAATATAIVGAPYWFNSGDPTGTAYLFDALTGTQIAQCARFDPKKHDAFGRAVAISAGIALVSAPGSQYPRAHLLDSGTGTELLRIAPDDGRGGFFGESVALTDAIALVGAPIDSKIEPQAGSVFRFEVSTGNELPRLTPDRGSANAHFGNSVAVSGGICIIGAEYDRIHDVATGSAYLFEYTTGRRVAKLQAEDGAELDRFGRSVSMSGKFAIVGAPFDDDLGSDAGSAYVFDTVTRLEPMKLLPSDGAAHDYFGFSVAASGSRAVVGASGDDDQGSASGSVYLFDLLTGAEIAKLQASDGAANDSFGNAVALNGSTVIAGAAGHADNGLSSGAAYIFHLDEPCVSLSAEDLVAGERATFTITNGEPGTPAIVVYGFERGRSDFHRFRGYCAPFDIADITPASIVGGLELQFDANGEIEFEQHVPRALAGIRIYIQAAMRGTCPEECVSNLVLKSVQ